ncbi:helix-turn-helix transcriptional regulator [Spirosoma sp. KNUC1025]|uniref:ArsR/SmtB family transcription factor n=1 Tax=Spirosoma sp. KNUC1025 TaxID=2894082 RepID=UPI00386DB25D|nr:metalloregulator ArsR/SmtB family transcription factor [Spirosoma sp. KNUC1025]
MTDVKIDQVAEALEALAHPSRLQILVTLTERYSLPLTSLQQQLQISFPVLSSHLTHLQEQHLLVSQQQGNELHYSLADASLRQVINIIRTKYM